MIHSRSNSIKAILFLLLVTTTLFSACKRNQAPKAKAISNEVFAYIYAYTSGTISKGEPITIRFTQPVVETELVGTEAAKGAFKITPDVKGSAIWTEDNTLVFTPEAPFEYGKQFLGSVNLHQLFKDVPAAAKVFEFNFQIRDLYFEVVVDGIQAANLTDLSQQNIIGQINFSDEVDNAVVEQLLEATQSKEKRAINWNHSGRTHHFTVRDVRRSNVASSVELKWDGAPMKLSYKGESSVKVPSLSDFTLMDAKIVQQGEPYIVLTFSDPILADQDLNGLIKLPNYYGNLRFDVDGNRVRVYPSESLNGEQTVQASQGIKNTNKVAMAQDAAMDVFFQSPKPEVKLAGQGVILPNSEGLIFPFEAIALEAVDIEVFKIHDNNILQFLQVNELDQQNEMERVGNVIFQKRIALKDLNPAANPTTWTHYAIDLAKLITQDPDAIYQVRIGFRQNYAAYNCENATSNSDSNLTLTEASQTADGEIVSIWNDDYEYYEGFRWDHQENPCFQAYYRAQNFVRRNVLMSNLGLVAKKGRDGSLLIAVSDIRTTQPMSGVQLQFYNEQNQVIHTMKTDGDGIARAELEKKAHLVVAEKSGQKGYLRMTDGYSLSLSRFDVEGVERQKGMKGYIYGERGVWRPGDSLYLHFVLENQDLPDNHPIQFELVDPRGQVQEKRSTALNVNKVYPLHVATSDDAPTGNWQAIVTIGGASFYKSIKVETIKPNRMKVELDFGKDKIYESDGTRTAKLQVNWLHGAPARNLAAKSEMELKAVTTTFTKFKEYVFDDPTRSFSSEPKVIFDGLLDANGSATFTTELNTNRMAPGMMQANIKTRAFEKGGDFSTATLQIPYYPYRTYAGVFLPKNQYGEKRIDIGGESKIDFVLVDAEGNPKANQTLKVGLYRLDWRWWWDRDNENLSQYNNENHVGALDARTLTTNAKGEVQWPVQIEEWGRYMVRVCDEATGHCSGDFFYAGYPWGDEAQNRDAAAMLTVQADKEQYKVGDKITLTIPGGEKGRCLISLESGDRVVETHWKETKAGSNTFTFYATEEMVPTIYAHLSLIQPHTDKKNDLPIRMYGLLPIQIESPTSRLNPEMKVAGELKPDEKFSITVSEKEGKGMAYTIAVVDDGLLDLTSFKTPNPWDAFFAKEALGVQSWDVYDYVLGAYGGQLERIFSIGGDVGVINPAKAKKANRFKPVVLHLGPYYLKPGKSATHQLQMPNYVGSVRAMVVASGDGAYGMSEKTIPVRKPLMILATLPRTLGPTEVLQLPVNVFAMDKKIRDVKITVKEKSGLINFTNGLEQNLKFSSVGDQIASFDLKVGEQLGVATFVVTATGGGETATQEIEVQVRNPNPVISETNGAEIAAAQSKDINFKAIGMKGTNAAILEVSRIPSINLEKRLDYLIQYPYGCLEQTTSSAFPQLYVKNLIPLEQKRKTEVDDNIKATLDRYKGFQLPGGSFGYWPGDSEYNSWSNNYAGHFMLEAEKQGYTLPINMKSRWVKAQARLAKEWSPNGYNDGYYDYFGANGWALTQAYRLYTLALAGAPELGAMNSMLENKNLPETARWRLAAAYAVAGKPEVAEGLIKNLSDNIANYREMSATYGSALRDEAMVLETLSLLNKNDRANTVLKRMAQRLSSEEWYGTQSVAYALMAIAKHAGGDGGTPFDFTYAINGVVQSASSKTPMMQIQLPLKGEGAQMVRVSNSNSKQLFVRVISSGQPLVGDPSSKAENLKMEVAYKTTDGAPLDPKTIQQGMDFIAEVKVTHPGNRATYREMALTQVFPAGWEIHNPRMDGINGATATTEPTYLDLRDDRVNVFFDLAAGQTFTSRIQLNAAYPGKYYLPTVKCEAMYDNSVYARKGGDWVVVSEEVVY